MIQLEKDKFTKIIELAKTMKSDIIYITPSRIYGTNTSYTYVKYIDYINDYNIEMCYLQSDMNNLMKVITNEVVISGNVISTGMDSIRINDGRILFMMKGLLDRFMNMINNSSEDKIVIPDITSRPDFNEAVNLKADEGIRLIKLSREYILTMFKNLIPINKGDKVDLVIKDLPNDLFLSQFTTLKNKPKGLIITTNILYLKIK